MDNSGLGGGILSPSTSRFLDLRPSIRRAAPLSHHHVHPTGAVRGAEDDSPIGVLEPMGVLGNCSRRKGVSVMGNDNSASDDDERSFVEDGNDVHVI